MSFKLGDKVVLRGMIEGEIDVDGWTGFLAILHRSVGSNVIAVKLDKSWGGASNSYDIPFQYCVWIKATELEKHAEVVGHLENWKECISKDPSEYASISEKSSTKQPAIKNYEAGQSIDEYVDYLLAHSKINKERLKWLNAFKNCVLPPKVKSLIEEALTVILQKDKFDEWGINEHFEKGLTNSILLYGPPGTGKSMISESVAAVLGKNLMKIDNGLLQSNIPGETERNIQKAFAKAKEKDCVLMLDECDSVLSNRDMVGVILSSEINALLTAIENYDGVVVLTTNRLHRLDPALSRRIIAKIELTLPTKEARYQIWQNLIPKKMPTEELDYELLASHELSGGEIKNAILLSARKAICSNLDKVTMKHFNLAIESVVESSAQFENAQPKHLSPMVYAHEHGVKTNGHMTKTMDKFLSQMGGHT